MAFLLRCYQRTWSHENWRKMTWRTDTYIVARGSMSLMGRNSSRYCSSLHTCRRLPWPRGAPLNQLLLAKRLSIRSYRNTASSCLSPLKRTDPSVRRLRASFSELEWRISATAAKMKTCFLFQWLAIALQRFNAVCVSDMFATLVLLLSDW